MKWIEEYRINTHDTDLNRIASATGVMRYLQDAANLNMEECGPSYMDLFDRGYAFILSRIRLSMYAPLFAHDRITCETWPTPSHGVSFNRAYRLLRDGDVVCEGDSVWALVDHRSGKLCRVGDVELNYGGDEALSLDMPSRVRIPREMELSLVGEHTVEYGETDVNGHMNNTHYADLFCHFLPMRGSRVTSINISFLSELPMGETVKVYLGETEGVYYFRTVKADGTVNAEAAVTLEAY